MYIIIIILIMFAFPLGSIFIERFIININAEVLPLIGKWFVFWLTGIRLLTAGLRQTFNPQFTAQKIFAIKSKESSVLVQELGFANISMGVLGISVIINNNWIMPSALVGCLFYGFAGIRHFLKKEKSSLENAAMISDLYAFLILLALFAVNIYSWLK
jgi:hypothetical protein